MIQNQKYQKKIYLTMNTDASFCPYTKAGGWAFWIKSDRFTLKKSGGFKGDTISSTDAEMKAIANALHFIVSLEKIPTVDCIVINTDSKWSIDRIKTQKKKGTTVLINQYLQQIKLKTNAKEIIFKHVKAHTGIDDARSWVNEWCDEQAKKHMRKLRQEKYLSGQF